MRIGDIGDGWRLVRRCPKGLLARKLAERVWGSRLFYELRCPLVDLPVIRSAKVPVRMVPAGRHLLEAALRAEGHAATGVDYLQVVYLSQYLQDGVEEPFLSKSADGDPIYCQWLIRPRHYRRLQEAMPGRYPALSDGEVVLEGAYTFLEFRGLRVMANGMSQLLRIAQQEGYTWATTYVAADNTAALRGCHHSGFQLYRAHLATHRFGRRRQRMVGTPSACAPWNRAVADPR